MGDKYDRYVQAEQAESQARTRLEAEKVGGDQAAIQQASTDYKQSSLIANTLYDEWLSED